jgi:tRNA G46 methylase TrmB
MQWRLLIPDRAKRSLILGQQPSRIMLRAPTLGTISHLNDMTEMTQTLDVTSLDRVLDVGCGDGRIASEIARRVPQGCVVGVDASSTI